MDTAVSVFYGNLQVGQEAWRFLTRLYTAGKVAPLAKPFRLPATISRSLPLTKIQHDGLGH